ncbi:MAG: HAD family hydrolase [Clostridia bacterium]
MRQGLIFDLDGTLWDSTGVIRPVWNRILTEHGRAALSEEDFGGLMGLTKAAIAARVFPERGEAERIAIVDECFRAEQLRLREVGGKLYPRLRETLEALRGAWSLYVVSNCAPGYLEAFFAAHGLRGLFDDWETHGGTGLSKGENIRLVVRRNGLERAFFLGDTVSDAAAASEAGLPFIHAAYGFGAVPEAVWRIEAIDELPALLADIERREQL